MDGFMSVSLAAVELDHDRKPRRVVSRRNEPGDGCLAGEGLGVNTSLR
jgi:hypothetical protein